MTSIKTICISQKGRFVAYKEWAAAHRHDKQTVVYLIKSIDSGDIETIYSQTALRGNGGGFSILDKIPKNVVVDFPFYSDNSCVGKQVCKKYTGIHHMLDFVSGLVYGGSSFRENSYSIHELKNEFDGYSFKTASCENFINSLPA